MSEAERAYERALTFLERRDRTEREVIKKLTDVGFSEDSIEKALEKLREAGLVNDADYAERYLESLKAKGRGRLRISAEMRRKGLPETLVRNTLEDGLTVDDEHEKAASAARKIMKEIPEGKDPRKAAAKINRRLVSLGFTYEVIGEAMRRLRTEEEEEVEE